MRNTTLKEQEIKSIELIKKDLEDQLRYLKTSSAILNDSKQISQHESRWLAAAIGYLELCIGELDGFLMEV
jgi:hypothetical protein